MIKIGSAISTETNPSAAADEVVNQACLALGGLRVNLALVFVSSYSQTGFQDIVQTLARRLAGATLLGCTTQASIGAGREVEDGRGLSLWLAHLPGANLEPFSLSVEPTPDGRAILGFPVLHDTARAVIVLGEPHSFPTQDFLRSFNQDHPGVPVLGGQATSAGGAGGAGTEQIALMLAGRVISRGAVGVQIGGDVDITPLVSQGCKPIGEPFIVTAARGNIIYQLGGKPPLLRLREILSKMTREDRARTAHNLHLGIVIDERKADPEPGDFLIRAVLQADPDTGAVSVGELMTVGQTVQFQVRDAATADAELRTLLQKSLSAAGGRDPAGALLFTCNGRGTGMFGIPDHDVSVLQEAVDGLPVGGMFCGGEIGPIASTNFLHGFTASVAMFLDPFATGGPSRQSSSG